MHNGYRVHTPPWARLAIAERKPVGRVDRIVPARGVRSAREQPEVPIPTAIASPHGRGAAWSAATRRGDFATAWAISDAILAARDARERDDPLLPYHQRWVWDGRELRGRHVLVRCYHGLGDTLQFSRYLPVLRAQAASLTVEAPAELLPLLAGLADMRLIAFDPAHPAPPAECDIEIMELCHALRLPPQLVPPATLTVAPSRAGGVGLCGQAGAWLPERSVPPALLADLAARCVSLLPGRVSLAELAGRVAGLDLVISVDTMVAHLAGTLGRPTWLLLKHDADWRWMSGCGSPWYPSMVLYRQPRPGDWGDVLARLRADLANRG